MDWIIWILFIVYVLGFVATFLIHISMLQMVTPGLALLRSAVWPYFWITGRPHGRQLPMD